MLADLKALERVGSDECMNLLQEAIRADPLSPDPYESLGRISLFNADFTGAAEWFRKSLDAEETVPAYLGLASALFQAGLSEEALVAAEAARNLLRNRMDEVVEAEDRIIA